jgi:hypothetical protein
MIELPCILLISLAMAILLIVVLVIPYYLSKQNQRTLEAISANQKLIHAQIESDRKLEKEKKLTGLTLQAYERAALFLERINPINIVPRLLKPGLKASQFEMLLVNNIREEYEHNMSQQLYISDDAWEMVKLVKENILNLINTSNASLKSTATANELAREILTKSIDKEVVLLNKALSNLKKEMQKNF